jgi:hypothetical protein
MIGELAGSRNLEHDGYDRRRTWENVYDDGSRAELLPYHSELLRLDECGPSGVQDPYVL